MIAVSDARPAPAPPIIRFSSSPRVFISSPPQRANFLTPADPAHYRPSTHFKKELSCASSSPPPSPSSPASPPPSPTNPNPPRHPPRHPPRPPPVPPPVP